MMLLTTQPLWLSGVLLIGLAVVLAVAGPVLARRFIGLSRLRTNNEVAGFKFATVGVLYAVLLGFAVIVVWEKFSDAERSVVQEAGAAATIYRLADGIGSGPGMALRDGLDSYLKSVLAEDWPAMERGRLSPATTDVLNHLYATLLAYSPGDVRGAAQLAEILRQLDTVTEARRARLVLAAGIVPGVIWLVLFGGALLTVGFTFFFGNENLFAQTLMTGALSVLVFSGLLVIVTIDHPFAGSVRVRPEALATVLEQFGGVAATEVGAEGGTRQ